MSLEWRTGVWKQNIQFDTSHPNSWTFSSTLLSSDVFREKFSWSSVVLFHRRGKEKSNFIVHIQWPAATAICARCAFTHHARQPLLASGRAVCGAVWSVTTALTSATSREASCLWATRWITSTRLFRRLCCETRVAKCQVLKFILCLEGEKNPRGLKQHYQFLLFTLNDLFQNHIYNFLACNRENETPVFDTAHLAMSETTLVACPAYLSSGT